MKIVKTHNLAPGQMWHVTVKTSSSLESAVIKITTIKYDYHMYKPDDLVCCDYISGSTTLIPKDGWMRAYCFMNMFPTFLAKQLYAITIYDNLKEMFEK